MNEIDRGQVAASAAEVYEAFFVPALFRQWAEPMLAAADIQSGQSVLDVACGTGVLARAAHGRVGRDGAVVGLDVNEGMLAVASRRAPAISWQLGRAEAIPFDDDSFDAVLSQFGLMFFDDRRGALREMARVLRPGGRLAIAVWDTLENTPGYAAAARLLQRLFGKEAARALRIPYILGDRQALWTLFAGAGLNDVQIETMEGTACFPSISSWMYTDIRGWTLSAMIDDAHFEELLAAAEVELLPFANDDGAVSFPAPAHIVTVTGR